MYMLLDKLIEEYGFHITHTQTERDREANICFSFRVHTLYVVHVWMPKSKSISGNNISAEVPNSTGCYRKWFDIFGATGNGFLVIYSQIQIPNEHTSYTQMYAHTKFHIQLNYNNANIFVRLTTHFFEIRHTKSSSHFFVLFCWSYFLLYDFIVAQMSNKNSYYFTLNLVTIEW